MRSKSIAVFAAVAWTAGGAATAAAAAPPANDAFADATRLVVGQEFSGSLAGATVELGESRDSYGNPQHTVWFRYRAPATTRVTVDTGGSAAETILRVYRGGKLSKLKLIGVNGWSSPTGPGAVVRFKARRGRVYRISIGSPYADEPDPADYKLWLSDGSVKGKGIAMTADPGQTVESVRAHGMKLHVSARRAVRVGVALRVSRSVADQLGLTTRVLGRVEGKVDYNQALAATIDLSGKAKRALAGRPSLKAKLRLTILRSKAPHRVLDVPVTL